MMTLIAAALAAATPTTPAQAPADAHAQHQHGMPGEAGQQHQMMSETGKECCCKEMMEKMHSGHDMGRMQDHQEHSGK